MKYITFFREDNKFDDIINDVTIKKIVRERTSWSKYLVIGLTDDEKILSYITLKYGDSIQTNHIKNFSPIPFKDYTPKKS